MRSLIFFVFFLSLVSLSGQYKSWNMNKVGGYHPNLPELGGGQKFNDVWGWYDSAKDREYAILGSIDSIYFVEILNDGTPVVRDVKKGHGTSTIWRDIETYKHYCYAAQDGVSGTLQIFDMSYLPDSVHTVYDNDSILSRCHTLFRDGDKLFCNTARWKSGISASLILSLENPEVPEVAGVIIPPLNGGAPAFNVCHDVFVRQDTLYCSGEVGLFIFDISDISDPRNIGVVKNYPEAGYNHSSWLSDDSRYLFFTDETMGAGIKVLQKPDMFNLDVVGLFRSNPGAVAHNPYVLKNELYVSYYEDGVYVFDITDPAHPQVMGFYDTYYQNDNEGQYHGFNGCWAVYPYLPSGHILALDQTNGLFVLKVEHHAGAKSTTYSSLILYPNPFTDEIVMQGDLEPHETINISISDITGKTVFSQNTTADNNGRIVLRPELTSGNYLIKITGSNVHLCRKMIRL